MEKSSMSHRKALWINERRRELCGGQGMTREEAKEVFLNRGYVNGFFDGDKWRQSVVVISDWLTQYSALNKIRSEIEQERVGYPPSADYYKAVTKCLQIIDKVESEVEL